MISWKTQSSDRNNFLGIKSSSRYSHLRLANGGVLVSTECLKRWLHVEVDRLASLKAVQNK